jgi:hypothetical protein
MRRSDPHEYRQAYSAQGVVCAEGSQLILTRNLVASAADAPSFAAIIPAMENTVGLPHAVLAQPAAGLRQETPHSRNTNPTGR